LINYTDGKGLVYCRDCNFWSGLGLKKSALTCKTCNKDDLKKSLKSDVLGLLQIGLNLGEEVTLLLKT